MAKKLIHKGGNVNITNRTIRKPRTYTADELEGYCLDEVSIECTKCKDLNVEYNTDLYDALPVFFFNGWRATNQNCYCPKCAKKYLKLS